jgi:hypothetical protein
MKNSQRSIKKTKDDTISDVNKKKHTAPTSITKTSRATGPRKTGADIPKTGVKSQSRAQKESGVSKTGATRVKNNPQTDNKFSSKKER